MCVCVSLVHNSTAATHKLAGSRRKGQRFLLLSLLNLQTSEMTPYLSSLLTFSYFKALESEIYAQCNALKIPIMYNKYSFLDDMHDFLQHVVLLTRDLLANLNLGILISLD